MPSRTKRKRYRSAKASAEKAPAGPETPEKAGELVGPEWLHTASGSRDQMMIQRAIREQWPIKDEYRQPIIDGQVRIAIDPSSEPGPKTRAARTLIMANKQNMDADRLGLVAAGIIGAHRDPFEAEPTNVIQATQIHIHLPDNLREDQPVTINASNARKTSKRKRS